MKNVLKLTKKIQDVMHSVIAVLLALVVSIIVLQTFTRDVIFYSLPWSEELSRYLFAVLILFGINISIGQENMIRMDLIDGFISKKAKHIFRVCYNVIAIFISGIFFYNTFSLLSIGALRKSPAMLIPMNIVYFSLVIGFGLALFSAVMKTLEILRNKERR